MRDVNETLVWAWNTVAVVENVYKDDRVTGIDVNRIRVWSLEDMFDWTIKVDFEIMCSSRILDRVLCVNSCSMCK